MGLRHRAVGPVEARQRGAVVQKLPHLGEEERMIAVDDLRVEALHDRDVALLEEHQALLEIPARNVPHAVLIECDRVGRGRELQIVLERTHVDEADVVVRARGRKAPASAARLAGIEDPDAVGGFEAPEPRLRFVKHFFSSGSHSEGLKIRTFPTEEVTYASIESWIVHVISCYISSASNGGKSCRNS